MQIAQGIIVAERFRLIRPLGEGGMGAVWLAQHTALDIPCALKFIHEEAAKSGELRARFEREAKTAAQLRSPHVVQILDHGVWEGTPYIAMELLEGEDLEHRLQRLRLLPPREALTIVGQVGRALTKAHAAGLVHRDLKPANIFLVRDEDREIAKVLDFGVAKVKETVDGATKTGAVLGTPYYMSPEQARGSREIDHRSDLWALAVVTYQCVTGQLPFMGEALGDLFVKIIVEPLPVPSRVAQVPPGFDGWWMRAAARDPAQRFQTAKELTDNLALALGVTAVAGVEVGSPMAAGGGTMAMTPSPIAQSGQAAAYQSGPQQAYQSGQAAAYQSGQAAAYQSGQAAAYQSGPQQAYQSGQAAAYQSGPHPAHQSGQSPAYQSGPQPAYQSGQSPAFHQSSGGVLGSGPVPGVAAAPAPARSGRGGLVVGVVGVLALLGGGGAFFATRSKAETKTTPDSAVTATPTAVVTAAPSAVVTTAPAAPPTVTPTAAPEPPPSAPPVAVHAPATPGPGHVAPPPPPKPTVAPGAPGGRQKTDFGF